MKHQFILLRRQSIWTPTGWKAIPRRGGKPSYEIFSWDTVEAAEQYRLENMPDDEAVAVTPFVTLH